MNNKMKKYVDLRLKEMDSSIYSVAKSIGKRETTFADYLNNKQDEIYFESMNQFLLQIFTPTELAAIYKNKASQKWNFEKWHHRAMVWALQNGAEVTYSGSYVNETGLTGTVKPYITIEIEDICSYRICNQIAVGYFPSGGIASRWLFAMDWLHNPRKYINHIPGYGRHPFNYKKTKEKYYRLKKKD